MHRDHIHSRWMMGIGTALLLLAGIVAVWYAPWWFWLLLLLLALLTGAGLYAVQHRQHRRRYAQRRARRRQRGLPERARRRDETETLLHELLDAEPSPGTLAGPPVSERR
jgi:fatty acid desaturase